MKKHKLFPFLRWRMCNSLLATLLAITLSLAGCTADDNETAGEMLPEGKYPLTFTATQADATDTASPQTRVSEKPDGASSKWDGDEQISVQIGDATETGTYTLTADGKIKIADKPLYWQSTASQTVTAWYPAAGSVSLADQSSGLAYVMKATASNASYTTPVSLKFQHQLAKIRVELTGTADMEEGTVQVKGYTKGTISNGSVTGSDEGWITMQRISYNDGTVGYEANVIPGSDLHQNAFQVTSKNGTAISLNLDQSVPVTNGQICKITLTVNKTGISTITLAEQGDVYTVPQDASVIIDGGGSKLSKRILISSGASVMLKNVVLNASNNNNTIEVQGTATLVLSGKNEITGSSDQCPLAVTDGTLTIDGTVNDQLKLIGAGTDGGCLGLSKASLIINGGNIVADASKTEGAGIGSYWASASYCGDITINGGIIVAFGGSGSAGIGSGNQCRCGNIIITGGNITATGGGGIGGAGIGSGAASGSNPSSTGVCENITISGKNTLVTATAVISSCDDIGIGDYGNCGTVTITDATVIAANGRIHGHR